MNIPYCLSIVKTKKAQVEAVLKSVKPYEFYEIWVDYIEDIDYEFINQLVIEYRGKLIFVFRRQNLETPVMDPQKRLSIISALENSGCFLDFDVITQQAELSYIQSNSLKVSLIASYHNFQITPEDKKLIEIMSIMMNYSPAIIKIATKCNSPKDAMRLLDLLLSLKNEKKKYIILGMGEHGTITRLYGTLWGNEMIFTSLNGSEITAPGQFNREEMESIFKILDSKH